MGDKAKDCGDHASKNAWIVSDYFKNHPGMTTGYAITMLTFPLGVIVIPAVGGALVDQIKSGLPFSVWKSKLIIIIGLFLIILVSHMVGTYLDSYTAADFSAHVRSIMLERLMQNRAYSYSPVQVSSTVAKLIMIPMGIFEMIKIYRNTLIPGAVTLLAMVGYFFWVEPRVGAIVLALLLGMTGVMIAGQFVCQDGLVAAEYGHERILEDQGDVLDTLMHTLSVDAREPERERAAKRRKGQLDLVSGAINCANHFTGLVQVFAGIFIVAVVVYTFSEYKHGRIASDKMMGVLFVLMCSRHVIFNAMGAYPGLLKSNADMIKMCHFLDELDTGITEANAAERDDYYEIKDDNKDVASLEFKNVSFSYPEKRSGQSGKALDDLSFKASPNDRVLVYGHIGSGKSTAAYLALGLQVPTNGKVFICGHDSAKMSRKDFAKTVAYVPQAPRLLNRTVYENLSHGIITTREEAQKAMERFGIDFIGLDDNVGKFGEKLSTGQRVMIYLIKVLLQNAKIIVADEISANLDPIATAKVVRILREVSKERVLLFISHSPPDLDFTHTLRLENGKQINNQ